MTQVPDVLKCMNPELIQMHMDLLPRHFRLVAETYDDIHSITRNLQLSPALWGDRHVLRGYFACGFPLLPLHNSGVRQDR